MVFVFLTLPGGAFVSLRPEPAGNEPFSQKQAEAGSSEASFKC